MGDILFLAHRVPYPPNRGDKIRGFHILRYLAVRRDVHLVAFAEQPAEMQIDDTLARLTRSRSIVRRSTGRIAAGVRALISRRPVSLAAFDAHQIRASVERILKQCEIDTIYVFSSQMAQYVPAEARQRVVMDFVDIDSAKFAAYADTASRPTRWMMRREARLLLAHDLAVARRADASLFVSAAEADLFRAAAGQSEIVAVENGIDTGFFDPAAAFQRIEAAVPLLVFTGQMDYPPNIEAVTWFAEAILPQVRLRYPMASFAIVGRAPGDRVRALGRLPGVSVVGEVPDVRGWLAAAAVVVAPLRVARGIQNKVLEAMAMARPVVASAAAAEGIDHADTITVGATAGEIVDAVLALLDDPAGAARLGDRARRHVIERYGWEARLAPLETILGIAPAPIDRRSAGCKAA